MHLRFRTEKAEMAGPELLEEFIDRRLEAIRRIRADNPFSIAVSELRPIPAVELGIEKLPTNQVVDFREYVLAFVAAQHRHLLET